MLPAPGAARPLIPVVERAEELHRQNNRAEAEKLCREVLELAPGQPEALSLLYRIHAEAGQERAADALLRRIVTLHPNTFWAINELTLALLKKGRSPRPRYTPATRYASRRRTRNRTI